MSKLEGTIAMLSKVLTISPQDNLAGMMVTKLDLHHKKGIKGVCEIFTQSSASLNNYANLSKIQSNTNIFSCLEIRKLAKIVRFSSVCINQPSDLGLLECIF